MISATIRQQIADVLGWTVAETAQFDYLSLRELLRGTKHPRAAKLVHELTVQIGPSRHRGGLVVIGERYTPPRRMR